MVSLRDGRGSLHALITHSQACLLSLPPAVESESLTSQGEWFPARESRGMRILSRPLRVSTLPAAAVQSINQFRVIQEGAR